MPSKVLKRSQYKWLHAGIFKNAEGQIKDIWYAFEENKHSSDGWAIVYASDPEGSQFCNLNVGLNKVDSITWDDEHQQGWYNLLTSGGSWQWKRAKLSRNSRRQALLDHWLDRRSRDRYPQGRDHDRYIGPPINVIHSVDDKSKATDEFEFEEYAEATRAKLRNADCYPGTKIPFSTEDIEVGAWRDAGRNNPLEVAADFLTGFMANHNNLARVQARRYAQIESAFYALGWRLDRVAMAQATEDIRNGRAGPNNTVFQSPSWTPRSCLRVDRFKGKDLRRLMRRIRKESDDDSDEEGDNNDGGGDDDDGGGNGDDDRRGPGRRDGGGSGGRGGGSGNGNGRPNDHFDDGGHSDSESDDNRGDGGRGSKARQRRLNRDMPRRSHHSEANHDSEDEDSLFVSQREPSYRSPILPSLSFSMSSRSGSRQMQVLAGVPAKERARHQNQESENLDFQVDDSPSKGKGKATSSKSSLGKRKRDESEDVKIEDDDLVIDEARSAPPCKKTPVREDPVTKVVEILDDDEMEFVEIPDDDGTKVDVKRAGSSVAVSQSVEESPTATTSTLSIDENPSVEASPDIERAAKTPTPVPSSVDGNPATPSVEANPSILQSTSSPTPTPVPTPSVQETNDDDDEITIDETRSTTRPAGSWGWSGKTQIDD